VRGQVLRHLTGLRDPRSSLLRRQLLEWHALSCWQVVRSLYNSEWVREWVIWVCVSDDECVCVWVSGEWMVGNAASEA
jgi:hypothetical protein